MAKPILPEQRRRLLRTKRKITALLPLVSEDRARNMKIELVQINRVLGLSGKIDAQELLDSPVSSAGVMGIGGLDFQAPAPPGVGRLIRLPFYLSAYTGPAGINAMLTDGGFDQPAVSNPTVVAQLPTGVAGVGARTLSGMTFQTPQISWANLRVVGLQASQTPFTPQYIDPDSLAVMETTRPFLLLKELFIGGGANLLSQEGYIDAALYSPLVPEMAGLREYSLLSSPSVATIRAAISGMPAPVVLPGLLSSAITFSLNLICEVLDDDVFGSHIQGPYARAGALIRRPNPRGNYPRLQ